MKRAMLVLLAAGLSLACLEDDRRHAFYLEPGGAANWSVTEEEIRAGDDGFSDRARAGDHDVAVALRSLGAEWVETRVVRDRPPYTIVTEARFGSSAAMLRNFLTRIGFQAETELRFEGERTRLSFAFQDAELSIADGDAANDPVTCLLASVERYRFVLTEGEFQEASGFRLNADRTRAVMLDPEDVERQTGQPGAFYVLTWTADRD